MSSSGSQMKASPDVADNSASPSRERRNAISRNRNTGGDSDDGKDPRQTQVMEELFSPFPTPPARRMSKFLQIRQAKKKKHQELYKMIDSSDPLGDIETISFYQLMQLLCPPNDQFHGCELNFVETVFFDLSLGKASEMIITNKEGFLTSIKSEKRLMFISIQKHFQEVVRERRKAGPPAWRDKFEDKSCFDRALTYSYNNNTKMRTTQGSELQQLETLQHLVSSDLQRSKTKLDVNL